LDRLFPPPQPGSLVFFPLLSAGDQHPWFCSFPRLARKAPPPPPPFFISRCRMRFSSLPVLAHTPPPRFPSIFGRGIQPLFFFLSVGSPWQSRLPYVYVLFFSSKFRPVAGSQDDGPFFFPTRVTPLRARNSWIGRGTNKLSGTPQGRFSLRSRRRRCLFSFPSPPRLEMMKTSSRQSCRPILPPTGKGFQDAVFPPAGARGRVPLGSSTMPRPPPFFFPRA